MKLYRVCKQSEYLAIVNNVDYSLLGSNYYKKYRNSFKYDPKKKYLQFYHDWNEIFHAHLRKGYYVCEYDIPDELVPEPCDGYYLDAATYGYNEIIKDYVIESCNLNFGYLTSADKILESTTYEDYLNGDLATKFKTVYKKDRELKHEKKLY